MLTRSPSPSTPDPATPATSISPSSARHPPSEKSAAHDPDSPGAIGSQDQAHRTGSLNRDTAKSLMRSEEGLASSVGRGRGGGWQAIILAGPMGNRAQCDRRGLPGGHGDQPALAPALHLRPDRAYL